MSVPPGACCKGAGRGGGASGWAASALAVGLMSFVSALSGGGRVVDEGSMIASAHAMVGAMDGKRRCSF